MIKFQADLFSTSKQNIMKNVESQEAYLIQSFISKNYTNVGLINSIQKFSSLDINSKNLKVVTDKGEFVLKKWANKSAIRIRETLEIQSSLSLENLLVPNPIRTHSYDLLVVEKGEYYSLSSYVDGELYNPTLSSLESYFYSISNLFFKLKSLTISKPIRSAIDIDPIQIIDSIKAALAHDSFWQENGLESEHSTLKDLALLLFDDLNIFSNIYVEDSIQYSHYDLHPKNVLLVEDSIFGFLDFESCDLLNPNIAWGFSLIKMLRQAVVSEGKTSNLFELGQRSLENIRNVEFSKFIDVPSLPIFGRFELARRLAYVLKDYFENDSKIWFMMLPIQVQLLEESYLLFGKN